MEVDSVGVGKYFFVIFSSLLILSACGTSNGTSGNEETNINEAVENEEINEESESSEDIDKDEMNGGVMKLGETGFVDDGISRYEITPKSFEIFKERNGISVNNDDEVFILIDYTIKNISEEEFEEEDILIGAGLLLKNSQGNIATEITYYDYDFVDKITETIEPEKSYDSQLLFEVPVSESSEYTLHYESYPADVKDAEWIFTEDEAK